MRSGLPAPCRRCAPWRASSASLRPFWPSYIGESDEAAAADCEAYRAGARDLAVGLGAWVLQSNWAEGLNLPQGRGFGGSAVIDPAGRLMDRLPLDQAAMRLVHVG